MAKKKPRRAKAAKAAAKRSTRTRAAKPRRSAATRRAASAKRAARARKSTRKVARKAPRLAAARKPAAKRAAKKAPAKKAVKRIAKTVAKRAAKKTKAAKARTAATRPPVQPVLPVLPAPARAASRSAKAPVARPKRPPTLDRARKTVGEPEPSGLPSSLDFEREASSARSGGKELSHRLKEHTSTGPAITAGDIDANWAEAESVGDEAPGGDNPTPDQDVVDEIGRALGVEYEADEELKGGDEIASRDRHRWELDPASSDDFKDRD